MPSLNWIGKDKVINYSSNVPFQVLNKVFSYSKEGNTTDNIIVHGDNLVALKSLFPKFEGRVDVVYLDPPYNTGNEGWCYNDNVNDPKIQKWLGEAVGAEGEDLCRHDKWLCMMYPRLSLIRRMLSAEGVVFISIDDNELYNLKAICDEIFGSNCFVANISWQRTYSPRNDAKGISSEAEHILVYSSNPNWSPNKLPRTEKMNKLYKNPDNDVSLWRTSDAFAPSAATHQGMVYAIQHPFTGRMIYPYNGACWPLKQSEMLAQMQQWGEYKLEDLDDAEERAKVCGVPADEVRKGVMGIVLVQPLEVAQKHAQEIYDRGRWPKFFFTNKGQGGIARKTYLDQTDGRVPTNLWRYEEVGHTDAAMKEIKAIFGKKLFDTPKPTSLIEQVLRVASNKESIVLDAFAGSGTTGHATLKLNAEDGGHRQFVLIEMGDFAKDVTAERVKRAIEGYGEGKNAAPGTLGGFTFYELGETLFDSEGNLRDSIPEEKIREFIYYSETRSPLNKVRKAGSYLLDCFNNTGFYFYYKPNELTVLNYDTLSIIEEKADSYVIYADTCTLSEEFMLKNNIVFKKIPRDIKQF